MSKFINLFKRIFNKNQTIEAATSVDEYKISIPNDYMTILHWMDMGIIDINELTIQEYEFIDKIFDDALSVTKVETQDLLEKYKKLKNCN